MKKILIFLIFLSILNASSISDTTLDTTKNFCENAKKELSSMQNKIFVANLNEILKSVKSLITRNFLGINIEDDEILGLANNICKINGKNFEEIQAEHTKEFNKFLYKIDYEATNKLSIDNAINFISKINQKDNQKKEIFCNKNSFDEFMKLKETKGINKNEQAILRLIFDEFKKVVIRQLEYNNFDNDKNQLLTRICADNKNAILIKQRCSIYEDEISEFLVDEAYVNFNNTFDNFVFLINFKKSVNITSNHIEDIIKKYCFIDSKKFDTFLNSSKEKIQNSFQKRFLDTNNELNLENIMPKQSLKFSCNASKIAKDLNKLGIDMKVNQKTLSIKQIESYFNKFTKALLEYKVAEILSIKPQICEEYLPEIF